MQNGEATRAAAMQIATVPTPLPPLAVVHYMLPAKLMIMRKVKKDITSSMLLASCVLLREITNKSKT